MSEEQTLFISTLAEASTFFVFADFFSMLLESISGLYHLPGERANKQCVIFSADAIAIAMRRCVFLAGSPRKTRPWPVVPADLPSILLARMIQCAVKRCTSPAGESPARQLSLQPVAIGASGEATNWTKPLV